MSTSLSSHEFSAEPRPRLLIIDDDPLFRNLLSMFLRRDYLVAVAGDGEDGFQRAKEHRPDLAIIDVQMPGWDGLRTVREFRKEPSLSRIGIIMLTGDASRETVVTAIQNGANDYVIKSTFSREDFAAKVGRLLKSLQNTCVEQPSLQGGASHGSTTSAASIAAHQPTNSTTDSSLASGSSAEWDDWEVAQPTESDQPPKGSPASNVVHVLPNSKLPSPHSLGKLENSTGTLSPAGSDGKLQELIDNWE